MWTISVQWVILILPAHCVSCVSCAHARTRTHAQPCIFIGQHYNTKTGHTRAPPKLAPASENLNMLLSQLFFLSSLLLFFFVCFIYYFKHRAICHRSLKSSLFWLVIIAVHPSKAQVTDYMRGETENALNVMSGKCRTLSLVLAALHPLQRSRQEAGGALRPLMRARATCKTTLVWGTLFCFCWSLSAFIADGTGLQSAFILKKGCNLYRRRFGRIWNRARNVLRLHLRKVDMRTESHLTRPNNNNNKKSREQIKTNSMKLINETLAQLKPHGPDMFEDRVHLLSNEIRMIHQKSFQLRKTTSSRFLSFADMTKGLLCFLIFQRRMKWWLLQGGSLVQQWPHVPLFWSDRWN